MLSFIFTEVGLPFTTDQSILAAVFIIVDLPALTRLRELHGYYNPISSKSPIVKDFCIADLTQ